MTPHDQDETALSAVTDEPPLLQQIATTFKGRQRGLSILIWFDSFVLFAIAVLCAWRFFQVDTARMQILYATCFLFFMIGVIAIKIWYWMLLHRNEVVRRMVRLEQRIVELADHTHD